jgi:hypothetical protein
MRIPVIFYAFFERIVLEWLSFRCANNQDGTQNAVSLDVPKLIQD